MLDGALLIETLAQVAARMGEPDRAIAAYGKQSQSLLQTCLRSLLRYSVSIPCSIRCAAIRNLRTVQGEAAVNEVIGK